PWTSTSRSSAPGSSGERGWRSRASPAPVVSASSPCTSTTRRSERVSEARYVCPWCDQPSSGAELSCAACGAPVDVRRVETRSGWSEMPPIRDMARLNMGRSSCQIEGSYVPVADVDLAEGDGVYFTHHVLLWKEPTVQVTAMSLKGGWKRLFAGLPLIMT